MGKVIITTGQGFTDIDALACAVAYEEILKAENKDVTVVLPGVLNSSITETVKKWDFIFEKEYGGKDYKAVLVDVSDPVQFAIFVDLNKVIEVYDHRAGFENYWTENLGNSSHIEMVGACATLIFEEFEKRIKPLKIPSVSANLLYTAIVSNTLNFKASVTTKRDIDACKKIIKFVALPVNWIEKYFEDQEKDAYQNPKQVILNDTKGGEIVIGQLELWDSKKFFNNYLKEAEEALESFGKKEWFLTSPSISEGVNYLFTKNPKIKSLLKDHIDAKFDGDIGKTKKLWLRKEIIKELDLVK